MSEQRNCSRSVVMVVARAFFILMAP